LGGFKVDRLTTDFGCPAFLAVLRPRETFFAIALLHHFHEMPHFVNHAANRRRVFPLDDLMHSAQSKTANALAHVIGAADEADNPLHLDLAAFTFADSFFARFFLAGH
jgi:hypothetical protein